ncbi:MAG: M48 family metalloprotease [Thalassobaculum sp.]|uniref:M48 family metalloprotease n=1 Tax=Thalassobaculum sp. TaxID=2022740 RepID=UPI0032EFC106
MAPSRPRVPGSAALTVALLLALAAPPVAVAGPGDEAIETRPAPSEGSSKSGTFLDDWFSSSKPAIERFERPTDGYGALVAQRAMSLTLERSRGYGLLAEPVSEEQMNAVLRRIMVANGFGDLAAKVYLHADRTFSAVTTPDGGIYVNIGMATNLRFEDELAFLLAHELSHFLLRHHESDWFVKSQHGMLASIETLKEVSGELQRLGAGRAGGEMDERLQKANQVGAVLFDLSNVVIHPAWGREQEDTADRLGIDMMVAAGYNPYYAEDVLLEIGRYEEALRAAAAEGGGDLGLKSLEAFGVTPSNDAEASLFSEISKGVAKAVGEIGSDHYPADERIETVLKYIEKFHPNPPEDAPRPLSWTEQPSHPLSEVNQKYILSEQAMSAFKAGEENRALKLIREAVSGVTKSHAFPRLVFFEIRREQKQLDNALLNLKYASEGAEVPLAVYEWRLDVEQERGRWQSVLDLIDEAERVVGPSPSLLPHRILALRELGERSKAAELRRTCKFDFPVLEKSCDAAAEGKRPKGPPIDRGERRGKSNAGLLPAAAKRKPR